MVSRAVQFRFTLVLTCSCQNAQGRSFDGMEVALLHRGGTRLLEEEASSLQDGHMKLEQITRSCLQAPLSPSSFFFVVQLSVANHGKSTSAFGRLESIELCEWERDWISLQHDLARSGTTVRSWYVCTPRSSILDTTPIFLLKRISSANFSKFRYKLKE